MINYFEEYAEYTEIQDGFIDFTIETLQKTSMTISEEHKGIRAVDYEETVEGMLDRLQDLVPTGLIIPTGKSMDIWQSKLVMKREESYTVNDVNGYTYTMTLRTYWKKG